MKIVQFPNGQYAIRKGNHIFGYMYLDLTVNHEVWWDKKSKWFKDCLTDNLDELIQKMSYGDPI